MQFYLWLILFSLYLEREDSIFLFTWWWKQKTSQQLKHFRSSASKSVLSRSDLCSCARKLSLSKIIRGRRKPSQTRDGYRRRDNDEHLRICLVRNCPGGLGPRVIGLLPITAKLAHGSGSCGAHPLVPSETWTRILLPLRTDVTRSLKPGLRAGRTKRNFRQNAFYFVLQNERI